MNEARIDLPTVWVRSYNRSRFLDVPPIWHVVWIWHDASWKIVLICTGDMCQFSTWVRPRKQTPPSVKFPLGNSGKSSFSGDLVGSVFRGQAKWQIASDMWHEKLLHFQTALFPLTRWGLKRLAVFQPEALSAFCRIIPDKAWVLYETLSHSPAAQQDPDMFHVRHVKHFRIFVQPKFLVARHLDGVVTYNWCPSWFCIWGVAGICRDVIFHRLLFRNAWHVHWNLLPWIQFCLCWSHIIVELWTRFLRVPLLSSPVSKEVYLVKQDCLCPKPAAACVVRFKNTCLLGQAKLKTPIEDIHISKTK